MFKVDAMFTHSCSKTTTYSGFEGNTSEVERLLFNAIFFKATDMNYETIALVTHNSESFYLQLWGGLFLVLQDSWCLGLLDVWDEMA